MIFIYIRYITETSLIRLIMGNVRSLGGVGSQNVWMIGVQPELVPAICDLKCLAGVLVFHICISCVFHILIYIVYWMYFLYIDFV